jgi:hypothetical protein
VVLRRRCTLLRIGLEGRLVHGLGLVMLAQHRVQKHPVVVEHVHLFYFFIIAFLIFLRHPGPDTRPRFYFLFPLIYFSCPPGPGIRRAPAGTVPPPSCVAPRAIYMCHITTHYVSHYYTLCVTLLHTMCHITTHYVSHYYTLCVPLPSCVAPPADREQRNWLRMCCSRWKNKTKNVRNLGNNISYVN